MPAVLTSHYLATRAFQPLAKLSVTGQLLAVSLLLGLTFTIPANAQTDTDEAETPAIASSRQVPEELPETIEHLQNKGLKVHHSFAVGNSLVGWLVSYNGQEQIIYTTLDSEYLINGLVLDAQGNDLTAEHQKAWLQTGSWEDFAAAHFISQIAEDEELAKENDKVIYVFFDANCPFSQLAWLALRPYVAQGLEVRWLPVAYLEPSSKAKAAALLNAPQEEQADLLAQLMQPEDFPDVETGDYTQKQLSQLETNTQLMQSLGLNATPSWVWLDNKQQLESYAGMLRLPRIAEITEMDEQASQEPKLMRFR